MMIDENKNESDPIDEYTQEEKPLAEDANEIIELVPVDMGDREGEDYLLKEETSMDALAADEDADAVAGITTTYTEDEEIENDIEQRQQLARGGRAAMREELEDYHAQSPKLSGGDLDADWQSAIQAGEETVGGSAPTPDQDVVEELGEAWGINYEDDEPLQTEEKLLQRDRERWELNPASAETEAESETESAEEES